MQQPSHAFSHTKRKLHNLTKDLNRFAPWAAHSRDSHFVKNSSVEVHHVL